MLSQSWKSRYPQHRDSIHLSSSASFLVRTPSKCIAGCWISKKVEWNSQTVPPGVATRTPCQPSLQSDRPSDRAAEKPVNVAERCRTSTGSRVNGRLRPSSSGFQDTMPTRTSSPAERIAVSDFKTRGEAPLTPKPRLQPTSAELTVWFRCASAALPRQLTCSA